MRDVLPDLQTDNYYPGSSTPKQQLATFARRFVGGDAFEPPMPHEMKPAGQGVWRMRTADLRLDGWFADHCFFVIGAIETKALSVGQRSNEMYAEVIAARTAINLNNGKYLKGEINELIRI